MAQKEYKVTAVDGKVRVDLDDGTYTDFLPYEANKFAGLLVRASHEAVYGSVPPYVAMKFNFED
jgi:hypothetical protein